MEIDDLLLAWQADEEFTRNTTCWNIAQAEAAEFTPFPPGLLPELEQNLRTQDISSLYSHQAEAYRLIENGQHVIIATGTASGKTLCYNLPVLQALLQDPTPHVAHVAAVQALGSDQQVDVGVREAWQEQPPPSHPGPARRPLPRPPARRPGSRRLGATP